MITHFLPDGSPKLFVTEEGYNTHLFQFHKPSGQKELPYGWTKKFKRRQSGKSAGQVDVSLISPKGKRIRSNPELKKYLQANPNIKHDPNMKVDQTGLDGN